MQQNKEILWKARVSLLISASTSIISIETISRQYDNIDGLYCDLI